MRREAKMTSKGQVTIPSEIRKLLQVQMGDTLVFEADGQGVRLRPLRPKDVFAEYEGKWRDGEGLSIEEINAQLRKLRRHDG